MRQFDFYEFTGIIVPGTVVLAGAALCIPAVKQAAFDQDLSVGEAAISLILAYGLGQLLAALGNLIEKGWWRAWGGMPSDWPRSGKHHLIAAGQISLLDEQIKSKLGLPIKSSLQGLPARDWYSVVRQVYAKVAAGSAAQRVDIFNGNYGLNRGLAAALLAVLVVVVLTQGMHPWRAELLLLLGTVMAVYRMHRFGVHYARELFVQFLGLEPQASNSSQQRKE